MKEILDSVLSGLSELVYICDVGTYELVYLNEPGKKAFGIEHLDNAPCYRVLQGRETPCPFCTNHLLGFDSFYEWEKTNEVTGGHYLLRDKLLDWDGRIMRLEVAFDVTEREAEKERFRLLADASAMIIDCIKLLEGETDFPKALDETLRLLGAFFQADRAYVFEIEGDHMANTHEWCALGVKAQQARLQNLPLSLIDHWLPRFEGGKAVLIDDVASLPDDRGDEREVLRGQGIRSLIAVPITIEGELSGYLGLDNPSYGGLGVIEMPLIGLMYFVSASAKRMVVQRRVDELTWRDVLTNALSRAAFHRDFDHGAFEDIGFALVDADRLAVINREQGRSAGDKVLCGIESCLKSVFGDAVYRIGDDEFCAVAVGQSYARFAEMASQAARNLLDRALPASLGSAWHARCVNTTGLLDLAGDRMRSAKRGRHRAVDLGVDLESDAAVSALLRPGGAQEAVDAGMLDIHLMPQASADGPIVGAEALIRYHNPQLGMQALPSSFIPALEDMGEIAAIDFFALARACETVARWQREVGRVVPLAVNFSRRTIGEAGFVERVERTVASSGVDPSLIEIEITESAREENGSLLRSVIEGLRERGFRVSIDDFGVDNANFQLFIQLEFDVLKIDKSLVWGLGTEERTMQVICSLVSLCDDLGIQTVAEGIENDEQYRALHEAGCTRAQGYRIGRPQPIEDFERCFLGV